MTKVDKIEDTTNLIIKILVPGIKDSKTHQDFIEIQLLITNLILTLDD